MMVSLLRTVSGAVWKCCNITDSNGRHLERLGVIAWTLSLTSPSFLRTCQQINHEVLAKLLRTLLAFEEASPLAIHNSGHGHGSKRTILTSYISLTLLSNVR
jgi:hypothetical protein